MPNGRPPIIIQLEHHPASSLAAAAALYLHEQLNSDSSVPGLRIPTVFTPDDGSGDAPDPLLATEGDQVLVVLLADDCLAADARRRSNNGRTWGDYVAGLHGLSSSPKHRFLPVQLTEDAWPICPQLQGTNFLRAWAIDSEIERHKLIARRMFHSLIRQLTGASSDQGDPPVTIFLSHTKSDLEQEPRVVKSLLAQLTANHPEKTWFDSGDIATGSRFADAIEHGVRDAALLTVVTDSYSSRAWCRREVLLAKRYQRPVVIVDAVQERETRRFPYLGNTPVLRWRGQPQEAIDLLLRETLRQAHAAADLARHKRDKDSVLTSSPELVTIVHVARDSAILYPDPPLGAEELAVIAPTGVRVETPLERHAIASNTREKNLVLALSVSDAEDLPRFGLRVSHLESVFLEISRYLLLAGARLSYGGHLKEDGYTLRLANLLRDPIVDQIRGSSKDVRNEAELVSYLAWPSPRSFRDEARLGTLVEVAHCERPLDIDETLDLTFTNPSSVSVSPSTIVGRFAWARGLSEMRLRQTREMSARIVVGGKIGTVGNSYHGRMPGVLEEAILSIREGKPLFIVGAFGGCAKLVADTLDGVSRNEMSWAYHESLPLSIELEEMYRNRQQAWDRYESITSELNACGFQGLKNGLSVDENRELARTRSPEKIIELILTGLRRC